MTKPYAASAAEGGIPGCTAWLLLGVCVIGSNAFLMSPVLSDIGASLGATSAQAARAVAAYGGATAFAGVLLTRYASGIGVRRTLRLSGLALTLGIGATGLAGHWLTLVAAQTLAGLGAGVMLPAIYSLTAVVAPRGQESAVLGRVITGWSVAMVAGVPLSALVADLWGWRLSYLIVAALGAGALLGFRRLPESRGAGQEPGVSLLAALRIPHAVLTLGACFLYMVSFYGVYTFIGDFVQARLGVSVALAGVVVLAYGAGFGVASAAGRFIDRVSARVAAKYVLLLIAGVYLLLWGARGWFAGVLSACFLWGAVNHLGLNALVSILTQLDRAGRVRLMGLFSAVAYGGTMVAGITFGHLYEAFGFGYLLGCAAALCALSAALCAIGFSKTSACAP